MTPVLPERQPRGQTLRHDEELDGYLEHHMVFTDISMNKDNRVGSCKAISTEQFLLLSYQSHTVKTNEKWFYNSEL